MAVNYFHGVGVRPAAGRTERNSQAHPAPHTNASHYTIAEGAKTLTPFVELFPANSAAIDQLLLERLQIDRVRHAFESVIVGVQMVAAVGRFEQPRRVLRIARGCVEIDHAIKGAAGPYPLIDLLPRFFQRRLEVKRSAAGQDSRSVDYQSAIVRGR